MEIRTKLANKELTCLFYLIACSLLLTWAQEQEQATLEALCSNKQLELTRISQVRSLIKKSQEEIEQETCLPYHDSLRDLDEILVGVETGKTCNLELVDKIRKYQYTYISNEDSVEDRIPEALKKFFFTLGFQLSAECKIVMINNFETSIKGLVSDSDYALFDVMGSTSKLAGEELKITDYDDIILPKDFTFLDPKRQDTPKLLIKVKTGELIRRVDRACRLKFRPIYSKLILPLIELSNLGYNYQAELLARELAELKENKLVRRWYTILQVCEAFQSLEVYEDDGPDDVSISGRHAITLISKNEAKRLRKVTDSVIDNVEEQHVEYDPPVSHNSDELWIVANEELDQLIAKYQVKLAEEQRIKKNLTRKIVNRVKEGLKSGKIFPNIGFNRSERNTVSSQEVIESLISEMDEVVSNSDQSAIDSPVSGWQKKSKNKNKSSYVPPKVQFLGVKKNGTRMSTWFYDSTLGHFAPSRLTICFMVMGAFGVVLILVALSFATTAHMLG